GFRIRSGEIDKAYFIKFFCQNDLLKLDYKPRNLSRFRRLSVRFEVQYSQWDISANQLEEFAPVLL
ncbi:MAG: hypothetical protein WBJ23_05400, partial [Anaerolineaceae bacterium]